MTEAQSWTAREIRTQERYVIVAQGITGTPRNNLAFQPDGARVSYSRIDDAPWKLDRAEVTGYRYKQDGTVGRATARHIFYRRHERPGWLNELIDAHRPC
jgi:hypothetical protein